MAKYPGLMRRSTRWYVRMRVPQDLVDFLGRSEIWRSLKTGDHREAVRRYTSVRADLQRWLDRQRRRRDAGERLNGEAPRFVVGWFHEQERRAAHLDFGLVGELLRSARAEADQELVDLLDGGSGEAVQATVDRILISAGWPARPHRVGEITARHTKVADGEVPAALYDLVRRALIEAARRRLDRLHGRPGAAYDPLLNGRAPAVQPVANGHDHAGGLTVGELVERFRAEKEPGQSAKLKSDYAMLYEVIGDLWGNATPGRAITREHCRQVKTLFEALPSNAKKRLRGKTLVQAAEHARAHDIAPMNPKTANQHLARLASMWGWALQEEFLDRNPAAGLKVSAPETDPRHARRPLTIDQLKKVYNVPLYRGCQDDQNGYSKPGPKVVRRGRFWVPLICTFAGLRMGEACQLGVDDVTTEHGVDVIRVRPDAEAGTRLKTEYALREVPIHAELIKLGLLDHVAAMRDRGEVRLFPELPRDRRGSYAGHFQRWANRFLENCGAKGDRQSFHSLRHSFTDSLRRAGATGELIDGMLGWTRGNMRDRYGSGPWIMMLDEVMQRVRYDGLDLKHLYIR